VYVTDDGAAVRSVNVDRDVSGQRDAVEPPVLVVVVRDGTGAGWRGRPRLQGRPPAVFSE